MVNSELSRAQIVYTIALAPFVLFAVNDIGFCLLSYKVDFTPALNWKYTQAWPLNAWYIEALRSFHIPENSIAYLILANTNNVVISGIVSIAIFITLCGAMLKHRRNGTLHDFQIPMKVLFWGVIAPFLGLYCLLYVNFTDTYSLFLISIRRPVLIGLIQLNICILGLAIFVPGALVIMSVKILRDGLKLIGTDQ